MTIQEAERGFQVQLETVRRLRDQELQRYDVLFSQVKNINSLRDGEVSDLKIQLDELRLKLLHEEKGKCKSITNRYPFSNCLHFNHRPQVWSQRSLLSHSANL